MKSTRNLRIEIIYRFGSIDNFCKAGHFKKSWFRQRLKDGRFRMSSICRIIKVLGLRDDEIGYVLWGSPNE
ncbi:MAG: hypothetical protein IKD66_11960 [Solobacterium sp.]|nr:hypothetical protein [Solobacterium sp.]